MIASLPLAVVLAAASGAAPAVSPPTPPPAAATPVAATPVAIESGSSAARSVPRTPGDPYERFNRRMFRSQQGFDRAILRPAALGYTHVVPAPARGGIRHAIANLTEPVVFLNYLLQLKLGKAAETLARFAINSTLGIGGLIDLARLPGIRLPHRPNGFGDTLGFYGVRPGAYLFLPFVGPTTVRDFLGGQADGLVLPLAVGRPFTRLEYQAPHAVLSGLDRRAEADGDLRALLDGAVDPYATLRSVYLQDRAGEIAALKAHRAAARPPRVTDPLAAPDAAPPALAPPELDDPLTDPAASPPAPSPAAVDPAAPVRR